ncbi:MAG: thiol peroxidase, partial [Planctomycetota bacterium]|nr:thiol peroxidase [Planctomycetota bacterium]
MSRSNAITFKGNPMTLAGDALQVGDAAPDFTLRYFQDGFQTLTKADLAGKKSLISVVPSLDTGVCAIQTKTFNEKVGSLGDGVNVVTVSLDLPFAQGRFCGDEGIENLRSASDYFDRNFGNSWGVLIEELMLLTRAVFVLDESGTITHAEIVPEVTDEPNYEAALDAL